MTDISKFNSKEELFYHLHSNKSLIIAQKKSATKQAEPVSFFDISHFSDKSEISNKALSSSELLSLDKIRVKSVINTTNLFDSHRDVHIKGLWNKTLKEQSIFYLVKEHLFNFDNILSDDVTAYTRNFQWNKLGYDWNGSTEALIFDSILKKQDNPKMFERYVVGKVRNHSVGMQYVKIFLAINSDESEYKEEKEVWNKYFDEIANKESVKDTGFFWAVTEAKIIEGSAVTRGSNFATPTQSITEVKNEPSSDTKKKHIIEPVKPLSIFGKIGTN